MTNSQCLITIERFKFKPDWTIGTFLVQDRVTGYSMEDEVRKVKVNKETCIPEGIYPLATRYSPKFSKEFFWNDKKKELIGAKDFRKKKPLEKSDYVPHDLIWITNVPNFSLILWHPGNTDDDTDGCIVSGKILGVIKDQEAVLQSRIHYLEWYPRLYPIIKGGNQFIQVRSASASEIIK